MIGGLDLKIWLLMTAFLIVVGTSTTAPGRIIYVDANTDDYEPSDESDSFSIRKASTSITLTPLADSWMQDEGGNSRDTNMGASNLMAVGGRWFNTYFRGFIRFDLSSIPYDATISNAKLRLYHTLNAVEGSNYNNIRIYGLLRDWREYEVTWNNYATGLPWTTPGSGSIGNDRENTLLAVRSFTRETPINQYYDFDITSAIQDCVDGSKPNYGFILIGKEAPAENRYFSGFSTKESVTNSPILSVMYIPIPAIIQPAIDDANDGDTIVIEPGNYPENINFKGKNLTLRSINPDNPAVVAATVISGRSHAPAVTFSTSEGPTCVLVGFTITGGNTGILCSQASPTIINCVVTGNFADNYGGGIRCQNYSNPKISNCTISGNYAPIGGGIYYQQPVPPPPPPPGSAPASTLVPGTFTATNCTITNCAIAGNTAQYGGGMYNDSGCPMLINCTFSENSATDAGGGMYNRWNSNPTLTNCTFTGNMAGQGNGICCASPYSASLALNNCILWDGDDEIWNDSYTISISYSDVQGGWPGVGNIDADPCFVQPDNNDFHLRPVSSCIDAGDPNSEFGLEPELDGGRINMGAYGNTPEATSKGGLVLQSYNIVNKTRIGRTIFDYEFTVTLNNNGPNDVYNVQLELLDASRNVMILDPNVCLAFMASGVAATSIDTFSLRVDRAIPIDVATISWRATFEYTGAGASHIQMFTTNIVLKPVDIVGDLTGDGRVDIEDLAELSGQWLQELGIPSADIAPQPNGDGIVNFLDFAKLATDWLVGVE